MSENSEGPSGGTEQLPKAKSSRGPKLIVFGWVVVVTILCALGKQGHCRR